MFVIIWRSFPFARLTGTGMGMTQSFEVHYDIVWRGDFLQELIYLLYSKVTLTFTHPIVFVQFLSNDAFLLLNFAEKAWDVPMLQKQINMRAIEASLSKDYLLKLVSLQWSWP